MELRKIREGKIVLWTPAERKYDADVFFNPEAELVRNISVSALQVFQKSFGKIDVCDALSGTGARGLRYAKEVKGIKNVIMNDKNPLAVKLIKKNIKLNKLKNCKASWKNANILMDSNVFQVIDLDPFGSPVEFMDSAARSIYHKGFLMVTATDTAPLCGTYPMACLRKYGIKSVKTEYYAELGMRILITNIILALARHDLAFVPVLSVASTHYFRIFGKIGHAGEIEKLLKQFGFKNKCGPIYLGKIQDKKFCKEVLEECIKRNFKKEEKLMKTISEEIDAPFYHDLHRIIKGEIPKSDILIKALRKDKFKVSRTHFCSTGIKTNASLDELKGIIRKM